MSLFYCCLVFLTISHFTNAGFRPETFEKFLFLLDLKFPGWDQSTGSSTGLSILEFGNQVFFGNYPDCYSPFSRFNISLEIARQNRPAKEYFQLIPGVTHTSVDINGQDGAIPLDVRKTMTAILTGKYDVITNYGFTEHVGEGDSEDDLIWNQYRAFKNIHDVASIGTLFVHNVPPLNFWRAHGVCGYETDFFDSLVVSAGYRLVLAPVIYETLVFTAFVKQTDAEFISLEEFSRLSGLKSKYSHYHQKRIDIQRPSGESVQEIVDFSGINEESLAERICLTELLVPPQEISKCLGSVLEAFNYAGVYSMTVSSGDNPAASTVTIRPIHK